MEDIFFGSNPVFFTNIEGSIHFFFEECFKETDKSSFFEISRSRTAPLVSLGQEYSKLVVPAVPSADLEVLEKENEQISFPKILSKPLIKVNRKHGTIQGIQSGRRSAVIKYENKWYRLKGCGDLENAFPLRNVEDHPEYIEIRGCMFDHTAIRELYMSNLIKTIFELHKIPVANIPIGWWEYHIPNDRFVKVKKCCALFQTIGDKRLSDHGLVGFETLLPKLCKLPSIEEFKKHFPSERLNDDNSVIETWVATLTQEFGTLHHACSLQIEETLPEPLVTLQDHMISLWKEISIQIQKKVEEVKKSNHLGNIIAFIYWRLGRETGEILRIMHENQISWDLLGTHCNAHPNNLALIREDDNTLLRLLAPLDFDMAFTLKTFSKEKNGKKDDYLFKEYLKMEKNAMLTSLAGDEQINSGVKGIAQVPKHYLPLKWALRDTLVAGFISGYENKEDLFPPNHEIISLSRKYLTLAAIVTDKDVA